MERTRLPPGQVEARRLVVYAALGRPEVDVGSWRLDVKGLVKRPLSLSYQELLKMRCVKVKGGFHCVDGWSITTVEWEGVRIRDLAEMVKPKPEARWIMFKSVEGYSAPVPMEEALSDDSIIALKMNGRPLGRDHGFPARPIIPSLYAWKSVKWLREMEFMERYADGYWEERGYHERGNVWLEERRKRR